MLPPFATGQGFQIFPPFARAIFWYNIHISRGAMRGEVFTAKREVNAMLDLVKHETERLSKVPNQKQQVKVYIHGGECWISEKIIPRNRGRVKSYKVLIPRSGNPGFGNTIIA